MRNISPKVLWPVVLGLLLSSLLSNINLITPDMLNFLGPWKFFVLQVITTVLGGVVGYKVIDPARNATEASQNADGSYTVTNLQDPVRVASKFPAADVAAAQAVADAIAIPAPASIQVHVDLPEAAPVPAAPEVPVPTV